MTFHGLTVTAAVPATTADFSVRTVAPPPLPTRKIEFLGDSITAGFCNECESHIHDENSEAFGATWDFQIGELLNAQVRHILFYPRMNATRRCW